MTQIDQGAPLKPRTGRAPSPLGGSRHSVSWRCNRQVDDLRYLAPGGIVAGAEGAVAITRDDAMVIDRFHVPVEWTVEGHIHKGGVRWIGRRPGFCERHYLAQLPPCDVIPRAIL